MSVISFNIFFYERQDIPEATSLPREPPGLCSSARSTIEGWKREVGGDAAIFGLGGKCSQTGCHFSGEKDSIIS